MVTTGVYAGRSVAVVCEEMARLGRTDRVVGIDLFMGVSHSGHCPITFDDVKAFLADEGHHPELMAMDSAEPTPDFNGTSLLFIDCRHTVEHLDRLWAAWEPLLVNGAIVAFHDYKPWGLDPDYPVRLWVDANIRGNKKWGWLGCIDWTVAVKDGYRLSLNESAVRAKLIKLVKEAKK